MEAKTTPQPHTFKSKGSTSPTQKKSLPMLDRCLPNLIIEDVRVT